MSLRYKILAAVIGITVVFLALALSVILRELVRNKREFERFDQGIRQRTIRWIGSKLKEGKVQGSELVKHEFIDSITRLDGDLPLSGIKPGRPVDERLARDLVARAITVGGPVMEGDAVAFPDPRVSPRAGLFLYLDIPNFSPHEPLQKVYIVLVLGVVTIIVVIYVALSRSVIRPIERLVRAANRVAKGDYSRPVPPSGREDEIDSLVDTFNAMMLEVGSYRQNLEERAEEARLKAKEAEKGLVIAQRLGATGKLVSGIAHEINNPLAGMLNAARRLKSGGLADPEKREEYVDLITDGLQRIQETVKKVLQFTPHKVDPQPVGIRRMVDRALGLTAHRIDQQGLEVVVDLPPDATVFGDPFELQQVFLNVLINAMDAISEAGRTDGRLLIHGAEEGGDLHILFQDNGCGMTEDQISQAFDLFFTTKEVGEGTGLGLSIAHNVIQNHGGRIEVRSLPGEGTSVEITLPMLAEEP